MSEDPELVREGVRLIETWHASAGNHAIAAACRAALASIGQLSLDPEPWHSYTPDGRPGEGLIKGRTRWPTNPTWITNGDHRFEPRDGYEKDPSRYVLNGVCLVCGDGVLNSGEHIEPERHAAAVSEAPGSVVPPELCGIKGAMFDTTTPTGSCVFLKDHDGNHSWKDSTDDR